MESKCGIGQSGPDAKILEFNQTATISYNMLNMTIPYLLVVYSDTINNQIRHSFKNAAKGAGHYIITSWFLLYSIGAILLVHFGGIDSMLNLLSSQTYAIGIPLGLAMIGILTAAHDIKMLKQNPPKVSRIVLQIMVAGFLIIATMNDVVYFEIDVWSYFVEKFGTPEQQNTLQLRFDQAQMADLVNFFMYPVFFHGNRIWNWIREREKIVDQIEANMSLPKIPSTV
ncbi:MAG: hypothetical protein QXN55_09255 [Candidatus Nitrosotenuis sp.]